MVHTNVGLTVRTLVSDMCIMDDLLRKTSAHLSGYTNFEDEAC